MRTQVISLHTRRLNLRPVTLEDTATFEAFYADPEVMEIRKYGVLTAEAARDQLRRMVEHWRIHEFGMWVVEDRNSDAFIGECGLRWQEDGSDVELSYGLEPRFRGAGVATEAANAALDFGVGVLGLERIVALSRGDNLVSHRVLEKIGMTLEWRSNQGGHGLVKYRYPPAARRGEHTDDGAA